MIKSLQNGVLLSRSTQHPSLSSFILLLLSLLFAAGAPHHEHHVLFKEGRFHTSDGDVSGRPMHDTRVHSESLASFIDTFDHEHPIFLSLAEDVAEWKTKELLLKFPGLAGSGVSSEVAWKANEEHMKTVEHIHNVHSEDPQTMVLLEKVSRRLLTKIVDLPHCEVGSPVQDKLSHTQSLKIGIEKAKDSASAVFSHLRDIISRWFKHLFKGMSAWINAELKKPMWVEIAHEFDKIINFCGINLGYKIPFQPIDSLNPSLPTLGIVCQPLSDFLDIVGRAILLIGRFLKALCLWVIHLFKDKPAADAIKDDNQNTEIEHASKCCVRTSLFSRDHCALIPPESKCNTLPVLKNGLGDNGAWAEIPYDPETPMCCDEQLHALNPLDPKVGKKLSAMHGCTASRCSTLRKKPPKLVDKWTMLMPNSDVKNTAKSCGKCALRIHFNFAFTLYDFVQSSALSGMGGYTGFSIVVSTTPMSLKMIGKECRACVEKTKSFFRPGASMEQKYFQETCNPHSVGLCTMLAKERVCSHTWKAEQDRNPIDDAVRNIYNVDSFGESMRAGLESSGRYLRARRFCDMLDGITLNMKYRKDQDTIRHIIECNDNDKGAETPDDYFVLSMMHACHLVNKKILEEDKIAWSNNKQCVFYDETMLVDGPLKRGELNKQILSTCLDIFKCSVSSGDGVLSSSQQRGRTVMREKLRDEITTIVTEMDDTTRGMASISLISAIELLFNVAQSYSAEIHAYYNEPNRLEKCESQWTESSANLFGHPLWKNSCFRDDGISIQKAIEDAIGNGGDDDANTVQKTQCCVRKTGTLRPKVKCTLSRDDETCKHDGFTTVNGCCGDKLNEEILCKVKGCVVSNDGKAKSIVDKVKATATKIWKKVVGSTGLTKKRREGKLAIYKTASSTGSRFFGEILARGHSLFDDQICDQDSQDTCAEACAGSDKDTKIVEYFESCDEDGKALKDSEALKRERECYEVEAKFRVRLTQLRKEKPSPATFAAIMQHGYRYESSENQLQLGLLNDDKYCFTVHYECSHSPNQDTAVSERDLYLIPMINGHEVNELFGVMKTLNDDMEFTISSLTDAVTTTDAHFQLVLDENLEISYFCTRKVSKMTHDEMDTLMSKKDEYIESFGSPGLYSPIGRDRLSIESCLSKPGHKKVLPGGICYDPYNELNAATRVECTDPYIRKTCRVLHCLAYAKDANKRRREEDSASTVQTTSSSAQTNIDGAADGGGGNDQRPTTGTSVVFLQSTEGTKKKTRTIMRRHVDTTASSS